HSGAGDSRRRWPVGRFAAVADALMEAGATVVLLGSHDDRARTEAIRARMYHTPLDAAGHLSIGGLAGLLSRCTLVVGNDSGPLHLAKAVGAATVGIYWGANLINAGPAWRTRHRPLLSWQLEC